jgi:hypothetical protein
MNSRDCYLWYIMGGDKPLWLACDLSETISEYGARAVPGLG